ncbi:MarR family winged helix-turn-helix transcriptional regulator [Lentilitoribacter sp. EG35]|uniref:MarR family winged helix-turn-helix transcriptional regulator n=1 Tax=Lentilitoribacter sp. EG35 TaxID=3234192 RepID=UPI00345F4464
MDDVDKIIEQWNRERPDLDVEPMALIGRLMRIANHLGKGMGETFSKYDLNLASFDVLATLRRSGAPYALSPTDLMTTMMITSGTMTNRIDQLVKRGLVERIANENDGRGFLIKLTDKGFTLIDEVVGAHVKTQKTLVSGFAKTDRKTMNQFMKTYLEDIEKNQ